MITIQVSIVIPFRRFAGIVLCPERQEKGLVREDYIYDILLNCMHFMHSINVAFHNKNK